MSATTTESRAQQKDHGFWHGRSGLVVALVLAGISTYLLIGILTMTVPQGAASPGPKFFPTLIVVAGYVLSALLALDTIRRPAPPAPPAPVQENGTTGALPAESAAEAPRMYSDWKALGVAFGGFLAFALLIEPLGWILAAALLFFSVAYAVGSRRFVFDLSLALVLSSLIQLAFGAGLGLNLPAGILGGIF
ncbi:Tripartite tricarboxylate transporter TctB family protein [Arthrobacter saudimassiliensis]|uniref:Tripartite tricarboxylate transporter TctB family protein n=1 Tax=Arthrobacter saudimassiliensis TaxID=1461584 RepID=A0A078MQ15_9MICC|nr:Tripartite tricarboxylate transporter TctB family protein [Arthrobacter saudimassiliensis]